MGTAALLTAETPAVKIPAPEGNPFSPSRSPIGSKWTTDPVEA